MKKSLVLLLNVLFLATLTASALAADVYGSKSWEMGFAGTYRSLHLGNSAIPDAIKKEAANPSITNPYSGRVFGKNEIGTYDPSQTFSFSEWGLFAKYTLPLSSPFRPYLRLELQYPYQVSTHEGDYGSGYSYQKVLGSGVDYIRYTYGIKYEYTFWVEPEIGLSYVKDSYSVSAGFGYQRPKLTYYKGLEAFGKTRNLQELGSTTHDIYIIQFDATKHFWDSMAISFRPAFITGNGFDGWSIGASIQYAF